MADVPFPLTGETFEELKAQIYELIRQVYEEKIGGADLGDVFSIGGEVLQLEVNADGGLEKSENALQIKIDSAGPLATGTAGLGIDAISSGWSISNKTENRWLDCDGGDINVVSDVLGTLIDDLKSKGILG